MMLIGCTFLEILLSFLLEKSVNVVITLLEALDD